MNYKYVYLLVSAILLAVWVATYALRPESRRKMLLVSLWTAPLGLTEPLFVPSYWLPYTLFDLARRTRFDLESVVFTFAVGGITAVSFEALFSKSRKPVAASQRSDRRHSFHRFALLSPFAVFIVLSLLTNLNPIYSASIAMVVGAIATGMCRPDLRFAMFAGSGLFLGLYFVVFLVGFVIPFPGYVAAVWHLRALSGILVVGIPIEELMWAASLGAMWGGVYEHLTWNRIS